MRKPNEKLFDERLNYARKWVNMPLDLSVMKGDFKDYCFSRKQVLNDIKKLTKMGFNSYQVGKIASKKRREIVIKMERFQLPQEHEFSANENNVQEPIPDAMIKEL